MKYRNQQTFVMLISALHMLITEITRLYPCSRLRLNENKKLLTHSPNSLTSVSLQSDYAD
jgi:hypothetical protein